MERRDNKNAKYTCTLHSYVLIDGLYDLSIYVASFQEGNGPIMYQSTESGSLNPKYTLVNNYVHHRACNF